MARFARQLRRRRKLRPQAAFDARREALGTRRPPQETVASGERPTLQPLSAPGGGAPGGPGRAVECAADFFRASDWNTERLLWATVQLFKRRNPDLVGAGR